MKLSRTAAKLSASAGKAGAHTHKPPTPDRLPTDAGESNDTGWGCEEAGDLTLVTAGDSARTDVKPRPTVEWPLPTLGSRENPGILESHTIK